jgi:peptidyl-prolyl cis-trans isomerase SurA
MPSSPRAAAPRLILPLLLGLALPAAALPPAPAAAQSQAQANRIVAVVNGDAVSRADMDSRRRLFALSAGMRSEPTGERMDAQVLRLLIDERLRMQEVQRRRIPVTDEEVAAAVRDIEGRNNLPPGGLLAQIRRAGVEPRALYDQIRAQIGWTRLIRTLLGPQAQPGEAEVQEFMAAAKAREGQPEYLVSEIFIPVDDPREEAGTRAFVDDVIARLRSGVPFPVAATQFSQAQTALQGGDLGWIRPEQLDPDVARIVQQMPPGAVSNAIRVPGGWQIVALRQKRETGREMATLLSLRQVFLPFTAPLDPSNPTAQQRDQVERAQRISQSARSCDAMEAAARGSPRPADPGPVRLEGVPPQLRELLSGLRLGQPSQPIVSQDGVAVVIVCSRETRNLAELTPDQARGQILRDRVENLSRQLQRDLRRRAQIEMRTARAG